MNKTTDLTSKTIALVGLMGSGKSSIGRRLASAMCLPFADTDVEIVSKTNTSIPDIFEIHGELYFRKLEEDALEKLVIGPKKVLATGGGTFINDKCRRLIKQSTISVWLRATLDVLVKRTSTRKERPLLDNSDPRNTLKTLMKKRYPIYEQSDIIVDTDQNSHSHTVNNIIMAYTNFIRQQK